MSDQKSERDEFLPFEDGYTDLVDNNCLSLPKKSYQVFETFKRAEERNNFYKLESPEEILHRNLMQFAEFLSVLGAHHASTIEQQLVVNTHIDPIIRAQLKKKLAELLEEMLKSFTPPLSKSQENAIKAKLQELGQPSRICLDLP